MRLHRRTVIQLIVFAVVSIIAMAIMVFGYIKAPGNWFGLGRYHVDLTMSETGNLYPKANVTYRGSEVGLVEDLRLTDTGGVVAVLSLKNGIKIPSDLDASVHSQTPLGEQYVALTPRNADSPPLKNGDVIPENRTTIGPDTTKLLDTITKGLKAIPRDDLKTAIDESYTAVGGLGPELSRIVQGSTQLALDARKNLDPLINLIDNSAPVLDSQTDTAGAIDAWADNLAVITKGLRQHDNSLNGFLDNGPQASDEVRALVERLQPTLPVLLANLVSINSVAITYQPAIEQLLVLIPQGVAALQAGMIANEDTIQPVKGTYLDFNLNVNVPPPCTTGFLPVQQQRPPSFEDYPDRPAGDLYCRVPQDSMFNVRGARNDPCITRPGKYAPTVKMCESDENYVPLNDGMNWKGDPNATLSAQDIPQLPPGSPPAALPPAGAAQAAPGPAPPLAVTGYDPATGTYVGPDGHIYTQSNLAQDKPKEQTWQTMLMPQVPN
ncbi:MCE family protein [Mycobacterium sp. AZCC_0083]|uniref:MCE family protein n=1 Tax=Mycobacterium sp. AZCC_0083 TaxID=2735882 RepID=UPI0016099718|nr:MlaD family protein [Mycobacterium sp. AZCC_0083]MBB5167859.1 phospholipid/cholesterol/gamma-HCH transport system substrate-binding protein [Mycobacterium sp. AZCC_0083]